MPSPARSQNRAGKKAGPAPRRTGSPGARTSSAEQPQRLSAVVRVSRRNGRDGDGFISPDQQRDAIESYAQRVGAEVVSWHDETDSVSGRTTHRVGLQAALSEALDGGSDGVIVARVDRFARNLTEGLLAVRELHEADRVFIAVMDGIDGRNPRSRGAQMQLTIMLLFAEWQLESLTDSWNDARRRHVERGISNRTVYGYRRGADRRLVPVPEQARAVRRIFTMRAKGASWRAIADKLTEDGVPPPTGGERRWLFSRVKAIVENRTYLGELHSGEYVNPEAHKAIVKRELWDAAHAVAKTSPRRDRQAYLLAGLVRCASCGGRMAGVSYRQGKRVYEYYRCRGGFSWGVCPAPALVNAADTDAIVLDQFERDFLGDHEGKSTSRSDDLDVALDALRDAEADLRAFITSDATVRMGRELGQAWVDAGIEARTTAVAEARDAVVQAKAANIGAALPAGLADAWASMGTEDRRSVLSQVYAAVAVKAARRQRVPAEERVRVFARNDPATPSDLPGRESNDSRCRPIAV